VLGVGARQRGSAPSASVLDSPERAALLGVAASDASAPAAWGTSASAGTWCAASPSAGVGKASSGPAGPIVESADGVTFGSRRDRWSAPRRTRAARGGLFARAAPHLDDSAPRDGAANARAAQPRRRGTRRPREAICSINSRATSAVSSARGAAWASAKVTPNEPRGALRGMREARAAHTRTASRNVRWLVERPGSKLSSLRCEGAQRAREERGTSEAKRCTVGVSESLPRAQLATDERAHVCLTSARNCAREMKSCRQMGGKAETRCPTMCCFSFDAPQSTSLSACHADRIPNTQMRSHGHRKGLQTEFCQFTFGPVLARQLFQWRIRRPFRAASAEPRLGDWPATRTRGGQDNREGVPNDCFSH